MSGGLLRKGLILLRPRNPAWLALCVLGRNATWPRSGIGLIHLVTE